MEGYYLEAMASKHLISVPVVSNNGFLESQEVVEALVMSLRRVVDIYLPENLSIVSN